MALLRNYVRLRTLSVRLFSTELRGFASLIGAPKDDSRLKLRIKRLRNNVTLNDRLRANERIDDEGWISIRKELLSSDEEDITESTVDMTIVNLCIYNENKKVAIDYLQHLWDSDTEMNLSTMNYYLRLCYTEEVNETRTKYLLNIYNKIREKYSVLDASTAESCIMGISRTDRWKESFELIDMIKLSCKPSTAVYSAIMAAAFNYDEPDIGWEYLRELMIRLNNYRGSIPLSTSTAYLNYCRRNLKDAKLEEMIAKMFQLWGDNDTRPHVSIIAEYEKILRANGWTAERTSIGESGTCKSCSHKLSPLEVTPEQYKNLMDVLYKRVIVGNDVYQKTTPAELIKFLQFIKEAKPYDTVIDGLNVSYRFKKVKKPNGLQLTNVVKMCVKMGMKVLVIGRKYMYKWPKADFNYIRDNGSFFLTEDISADDPYLLYATLVRGLDTQFVSYDFMRQHKYQFKDRELHKILKYWQMTHQIYPDLVKNGTEIKLRMPPRYLPVAQKDNEGWHVPFTFDSSLHLPEEFEPPKTWVCFRKIRADSTGNV